MFVWKRIGDEGAGYLHSMSESVALLELENPNTINDFRAGRMILFSDYSGQHKNATHEGYSFLITSDVDLNDWLPELADFRKQYLPDGRRISFKQMREQRRMQSFVPFLKCVAALRANVITFLIDRRINSFFSGSASDLVDLFPDCFDEKMRPGTVEKILRISSFISFIISGFRNQHQHSLWFSDQDESMENNVRREQLAKLASYLTFGLTRWNSAGDMEFATADHPEAPAWVEDFLAIPDIFAGAFCKLQSAIPLFEYKEKWLKVVRQGEMVDNRALIVANWLAAYPMQFRHILVRLEIDKYGTPRSSAQMFRYSPIIRY